MASSHTIKMKNINLEKLNIIRNAMDVNSSYKLLRENNIPLVIAMPKCKLLNNSINQTYKSDLWYCDLLFSNDDFTSTISIDDIENYVIKLISENANLFLNTKEKTANLFACEELMKYSIRNGNKMRVRVDGDTQFYDKNSNNIKLEDVISNLNHMNSQSENHDITFACSIYCDNMKISNKQIKMNWKICQMKINKIITDCNLSDSDSDNNYNNINSNTYNKSNDKKRNSDSSSDEESKYRSPLGMRVRI